jgi:membrane associated rhomboid family serine protease
MLDDRSYMRGPSWDSRRSWTVTLIITLLVLFVLQACLTLYARLPLEEWFALSVHGIAHKRFWQLLTFQFMHSVPWPWHVLGNCIGLYFLGRTVEETLGGKNFLLLYFASGTIGGLVELLTTYILPHHPDGAVLGASAGVMGLLGAFATLYPLREITIFVFVFPITLRVVYIFWFFLCISAFGTLVPFDETAQAAHLGGLLTGVAFIRWGLNPARAFTQWNPFQRKERSERMIKAAVVGTSLSKLRSRSRQAAQDLPSAEFISKEVDPILDKISAHGIQSLTDREREILQAARAKMSKR